jgi:hypothetical protein
LDFSTQPIKNEFFILGVTNQGAPFRPSDWAERLSGAISCFAPNNTRQGYLYYSSFVRPILINGIRAVVVDRSLREAHPLAYHFVVNFAKDNDLQVVDACVLPE